MSREPSRARTRSARSRARSRKGAVLGGDPPVQQEHGAASALPSGFRPAPPPHSVGRDSARNSAVRTVSRCIARHRETAGSTPGWSGTAISSSTLERLRFRGGVPSPAVRGDRFRLRPQREHGPPGAERLDGEPLLLGGRVDVVRVDGLVPGEDRRDPLDQIGDERARCHDDQAAGAGGQRVRPR